MGCLVALLCIGFIFLLAFAASHGVIVAVYVLAALMVAAKFKEMIDEN